MTVIDPSLPPLEIYLLGLVDFDEVQKLQRRLVYDQGERGGASMILCEHPPTVSVGRSGSRAHVRPDYEEMAALGVSIRWVNRGGGCVLHLPGQISGYLILPLRPFGLTLIAYLADLHRALIAVLAEFDLVGTNLDDTSGVYLGNARVATVGVAVNRWIAYHGFTLNVGPQLDPFRQMLEEPGPTGRPIRQTSMEAWRQRITPAAKVRESLIRKIEETFRLERHHLYTQHPSIRRKVRADVHAQNLG